MIKQGFTEARKYGPFGASFIASLSLRIVNMAIMVLLAYGSKKS